MEVKLHFKLASLQARVPSTSNGCSEIDSYLESGFHSLSQDVGGCTKWCTHFTSVQTQKVFSFHLFSRLLKQSLQALKLRLACTGHISTLCNLNMTTPNNAYDKPTERETEAVLEGCTSQSWAEQLNTCEEKAWETYFLAQHKAAAQHWHINSSLDAFLIICWCTLAGKGHKFNQHYRGLQLQTQTLFIA